MGWDIGETPKNILLHFFFEKEDTCTISYHRQVKKSIRLFHILDSPTMSLCFGEGPSGNGGGGRGRENRGEGGEKNVVSPLQSSSVPSPYHNKGVSYTTPAFPLFQEKCFKNSVLLCEDVICGLLLPVR